MDFNRFTEKLQEGFRSAQSIASSRGQQQIDVEHLLLALVDQEGGLAQSLFAKAEVAPALVRQKLVEALDKLPRISGSAPGVDQLYLTKRLQDLLERAEKEAKRLKDDYISVEHVVLDLSRGAPTAREQLPSSLPRSRPSVLRFLQGSASSRGAATE